MKLLLDSCVWGGATADLTARGHDVVWAGQWDEDPGDDVILERATRDGRILVTLDKDFGELAVVRGVAHAGIVRLVGFSAREQAAVCHEIVTRYADELLSGGLVTARPGQVRVRPRENPEESE